MPRALVLALVLLLGSCLRESRMEIRVAASASNAQPVDDIVVTIGQQQHRVRALRPGEFQQFTVSLRNTQSMVLAWRAGDRSVSWEGPDLDARRIRALQLLVELAPDPKHPVRHRLIRR
jgi:hypothetical protein